MCSYLFPWGLLAPAIDGVQKEGEFQAFLVNHGGERKTARPSSVTAFIRIRPMVYYVCLET